MVVLLLLGSRAASQSHYQMFLWRRSWGWIFGQNCFGLVWRGCS